MHINCQHPKPGTDILNLNEPLLSNSNSRNNAVFLLGAGGYYKDRKSKLKVGEEMVISEGKDLAFRDWSIVEYHAVGYKQE